MKLTILKAPSKEDWILCKQAAYVTVGKETETEPTLEWKKKILKSVHSPIRTLNYAVFIDDVPSWVATHLVRHIHAQPFVSTQRNDRCNRDAGYDRRKASQDTPVKMIWYFNAEELMTICHKRLCLLASKETRETIQEIVRQITELCPEWQDTNLLVPLCTYRGGICTEFAPCEYYKTHGHGFIAGELSVKFRGHRLTDSECNTMNMREADLAPVTDEIQDSNQCFDINLGQEEIQKAVLNKFTPFPTSRMNLYLDGVWIGMLHSIERDDYVLWRYKLCFTISPITQILSLTVGPEIDPKFPERVHNIQKLWNSGELVESIAYNNSTGSFDLHLSKPESIKEDPNERN